MTIEQQAPSTRTTEPARTGGGRAVVMTGYGAPDVLRMADLPQPSPGPGQVVVRPRFATVNAIDWKSRRGDGVPMDLPAVPGWDVVGTVVDANGTALHIGQPVFGMLPFPGPGGAYAEQVVVGADALAVRPAAIADADVAGVMVALTARQCLVELGATARGHRVLVHGAAGGVGHMAVQIGSTLGAVVIGSASPSSASFVRGLGAEQVVDYHGDALGGLRDLDLVLDTRGGPDFFRLVELVRPGGTIVTIVGEAPGQSHAAAARGVRVAYARVGQDRTALDELTDLFARRRLRAHIDSTFGLEQAAEAHARGERGHVRGVIVLDLALARRQDA